MKSRNFTPSKSNRIQKTAMEKTEKNVAQLTDDEILEGFRNADEHIVKEYFYGYCRVAYYIYDRRYDLQHKPGMDFYSLAHEYYLALIKHDFRQLEDRKPSMSLKTWMVNGFRFLVLDKLKGLKKEQQKESLEERMGNSHLRFDVHDDEFAEEFRNTIDEICRIYYGRDSRNAIILQMLFVEGFKGKEIAAQLGISQPAVTERYNRMMHDVVVPYFKRYFVTNKYGLRMKYMADECYAAMPCRSAGANRDFIFRDMDRKRKGRVTPEWIDDLQENQVFVFGSNLAGMHGGGAARIARLRFGAVMGNGVGMQGRSYAIPTMQGGTKTISPYVNDFIRYAYEHPELTFLVTPIGCGIAGFEPEDIAPLFENACEVENIWLPESFWEELE